MSTTTLSGQLRNSGVPIAGSLRITLTSPLLSTATTPNTIYSEDPLTIAITGTGDFSVVLPWTQASGIPYLFEFFNSTNKLLYSFYAIVPELTTCQLDDLVQVDWDTQLGDLSAARVFERLKQLEASTGLLSNSVVQQIRSTPPPSPFEGQVWIQTPDLYQWRRVGSAWESPTFYFRVSVFDQPPIDSASAAGQSISRITPDPIANQFRIVSLELETLQSGSIPSASSSFIIDLFLSGIDEVSIPLADFNNQSTIADQKIRTVFTPPSTVFNIGAIARFDMFVSRNGSSTAFINNTIFQADALMGIRYIRA